MKVSNALFDTQNYARTIRFPNINVWTNFWSCCVWSKSFISEKIVPRNRNSKSIEGKQFINVRWGPGIVTGTDACSRHMKLGVLFDFFCHFRAECFHTLKIELDFFSRHGHWTLYWTGVYQSLLLKKKQRRSSCQFFRKWEFCHFLL